MKTRAPGKVVLSGAYSVLYGAPALVSAVDRYVECDSALSAQRVTPEVRAAIGTRSAPAFDASALRAHDRKLGLGSSAAIVVASLAALYASDCDNELELRKQVAERALTAHRVAQGGGSGIDVLASTWGTTLLVEASPSGGLPIATSIHLPDELVVEVWGSRVAASTAEMLQAVQRLEQAEPERHAQLIADLTRAAQQAANAAGHADMPSLIKALDDQSRGLTLLGEAACIPILTPAVTQLAELARDDGDACVLPSGAGGGDVALWVSRRPSDSAFRAKATSLDHTLLPMSLQARGVHILSDNGGPRGT